MKADIKKLHLLLSEKKLSEALIFVEELLTKNLISPYLLVQKARLIMLQNTDQAPPLAEVERCLLLAHEINQDDFEVIEELAHYYDVVDPHPESAKKYKDLFLDRSSKIAKEMREIM